MIPMGRANYRLVDPKERVRELTWALVDERIENAQWSELQKLLTDSVDARGAYIEAIQLHSDLLFHFKNQQANDAKQEKETPILGSLESKDAIAAPAIGIGG